MQIPDQYSSVCAYKGEKMSLGWGEGDTVLDVIERVKALSGGQSESVNVRERVGTRVIERDLLFSDYGKEMVIGGKDHESDFGVKFKTVGEYSSGSIPELDGGHISTYTAKQKSKPTIG
jgi:hypothetical protein